MSYQEWIVPNAAMALHQVFSCACDTLCAPDAPNIGPGDQLAFSHITINLMQARQVVSNCHIIDANPFTSYFDAVEMLVNIGARPLDMVAAALTAQAPGIVSLTFEEGEEVSFKRRTNSEKTKALVDMFISYRKTQPVIDLLSSTIVFYSMLLEIIAANTNAQPGHIHIKLPRFHIGFEDPRFVAARKSKGFTMGSPYHGCLYRAEGQMLGELIPIDKLVRQLRFLLTKEGEGLTYPYLVRNGYNLLVARNYFTQRQYASAKKWAGYVRAPDWRKATINYIERHTEPKQCLL